MKAGTVGNRHKNQLLDRSSGALRSREALGCAIPSCTVIECLESRLLLSSYTITSIPFTADDTDGVSPFGGITFDANGDAYGTTRLGGASHSYGTVFKISHGTTTIQTVASFDGANGLNSQGTLATDEGGNIYGATMSGGASNCGTVFKIPYGTNTIQTIASFNGTNGNTPYTVTLDAAGNIYGATLFGGPTDQGTVFEIPSGTNTIQTLASFNGANGYTPIGRVTLDAGGNIFGTTLRGGAAEFGTVFEIARGTNTIQTLVTFNGLNGRSAYGGVTMDADGNLYGMTEYGGTSDLGTVFKIPRATNALQTLASFDGTNGGKPYNGVTVDGAGNLYGTTFWGGPAGRGNVFEIAKGTTTIQPLAFFDGANGSGPWAGVTLDGQGALWGTTTGGGPAGTGTVFSISPPVYTSPGFPGRPVNISTTTIEAENFDNGGDGVAYHDTTPQNIGGQYRPAEAVDVNKGGSNGFSVGHTAPGEWLDYAITAPSDAAYALEATVANYQQGGTFHVEMDGVNVTGPMTVPDTGPWDTWKTITSQAFDVSGGDHTMRVVMDSPGYWGNIGDFDSFRFVPRPSFHGTPFNISTDTIEAEDFDKGGEGVGYHDTTFQNISGAYRATGADVGAAGNASNGFAVGYTAPSEWLRYTITAPVQGTYALQARVANYQQGGTFHVEIDGQNVTGTMTVPDSGPWDTWTTVTSQTFTVSPGTHLMRVVMDQPGYWGNIGDFDSFRFAGATPFHGTPFNISTDTIEAEDFDNGGEGVGYHDTTPQNIPGAYRNTGVDVGAVGNASNRFAVGYTAPGEWLDYSITAPSDGRYALQARVANLNQGGTFHVEIDGQNVSGAVTVPDTGAWTNWQTIVTQPFNVSAGAHTVRVVMDKAGYWGNIADFDSFKFVAPVPYVGHPFKVAGETIEAENFDNGTEGSAYHDTTAQNQGGKYRTTGVDVNAGGSNGYNVGYTAPGEWLKYSITNPSAATFVLQSTVASSKQGGTFHVEIDRQNVTGPLTVPDTGGWYAFQTVVSSKFTVSAGDHTMKVVMDSAGAQGAIGNFDYFRFVPAGIVTLVSQERSVTIDRPYPTADQVVQTDPGDFGPFNASIGAMDFLGPVSATQSSRMEVGTTSAQFTASLAASGPTHGTTIGWSSLYKVVFDVDSPVTYGITARETYPYPSFGLNGPGGPIQIPYDPNQDLYFSTGMLQPGRYTFSGDAAGNADFDVTMNLGSLALIPRPLVLGGQTIEAEAFDDGNEDVAYHDTTPQNQGNQYRPTGVDINPGGSYGYNVGYTAPGEWLKYSLTNPTAGEFLLQSAVASSKPGGTFHVEIDGQNVTGTLNVPDTAGWSNFQTVVSPNFSVPAGDHTMKVVMDTAGASGAVGNFDYFRFVPTGVVTLVSQQRSVTGRPKGSGSPKMIQSEPGNFRNFGAFIGSQIGADASQNSTLSVGATNARFGASGSMGVSFGNSASSSFQVVFDASTTVPYTLSLSHYVYVQNYDISLSLVGPDGAVFAYDPAQGNFSFTGTLTPGRYTLSAYATCYWAGFNFQLVMDIGSAMTAAPI